MIKSKKNLLVLMFLIILLPSASAYLFNRVPPPPPLSIGMLSNTFCSLDGCDMNGTLNMSGADILNVGDLVVNNLSVIGSYVNITVENYNVTGTVNADNFSGNFYGTFYGDWNGSVNYYTTEELDANFSDLIDYIDSQNEEYNDSILHNVLPDLQGGSPAGGLIDCYQETANVGTSCALGTGTYVFTGVNNQGFATDGLWDFNTADFPGGSTLLINYSIPAGTQGATWQTSDGVSTVNRTVPSSCLNYDGDTLQFKLIAGSGRGAVFSYQCFDGSWNTMATSGTFSLAEEAVYWNVPASAEYYHLDYDQWSTLGDNYFNQELNTYDSPTFSNVNVTNDLNIINGDVYIDGVSLSSSTARESMAVVSSNTSLYKANADFKADGVSDEVTIESAIASLPSTGGTIVLLDGTFYTGSSITIDKENVKIVGLGYATNVDGQLTSSYSNVEVSNVRFTDNFTISSGITLNYGTNSSTISNCWFEGSTTEIFLGGSGHSIENSRFNDYIQLTIQNDTTLSNNEFLDIETIRVLGDNNIIVGNTIEGSEKTALLLRGASNNLIQGNVIRDSGHSPFSGNGIYLDGTYAGGSCDNNIISNNIILNTSFMGIEIQNSSNNIVSSNRIGDVNVSFSKIYIASSSNGNTVINNNLVGVGGTISNAGTNSTIIGNYPGGASMEIQTALGEEIKMVPEGSLTATYFNDNTTFHTDVIFEECIYLNDTRYCDFTIEPYNDTWITNALQGYLPRNGSLPMTGNLRVEKANASIKIEDIDINKSSKIVINSSNNFISRTAKVGTDAGFGEAVNFDSVGYPNVEYMNIPLSATIGSEGTISMTVQTDGTTHSGLYRDYAGGSKYLQITYDGATGVFSVNFAGGGGGVVLSHVVGTPTDIHNFVVTYGDNDYRLYVDGVQVDSHTADNMTGKNPAAAITLGSTNIYSTAVNTHFSGTVDEFVMWNRNFSDSDAKWLYSGSEGRGKHLSISQVLPSGNTVGLNMTAGYHLNEGSGSIATDFSGNNRNGNLLKLEVDDWVTGLVGLPATGGTNNIWKVEDPVELGQKGIITFGDPNSESIIESNNLKFKIGGIEVAELNSDGEFDVQSHNIINVLDPIDDQDAATKNYVDSSISSLNFSLFNYADNTFLRNDGDNATGNYTIDGNLNVTGTIYGVENYNDTWINDTFLRNDGDIGTGNYTFEDNVNIDGEISSTESSTIAFWEGDTFVIQEQ